MRRKRLICFLLFLLLLLTACTPGEDRLKEAMEFRGILEEHGGCGFTAHVTTELDGRSYAFSMDAVCEADGKTTLTVTAPEELAGITAETSEVNAVLRFGETELDFGTLDSAMTSPLYAPLVFARCWQSAYIDSAGEESGGVCAVYRLGYEDSELVLECLFRGGVPAYCELYHGERMLLAAKLENLHLLTSEVIK